MTAELLIMSFSRLASDARLLREITLFTSRGPVVTAGWGPAVGGAARHIELQPPAQSPARRRARFWIVAVLLRLRLYRLMYWTEPGILAARRALRRERPARVLANDIEMTPLALSLAPARSVHVDLHEFVPGLHDDNPRWVRLRKPYYEWILRRYVMRAASVTTVGAAVAAAYRPYGIDADVVTNSPTYRELPPSRTSSPIRMIHPGAALRGRRIENMMRAAAGTTADVTLDLYLTPNDPVYLQELRELADDLGPRIAIHDPVPHAELLTVINAHDVGIHVLPPTVTNNALALPNKLFDFIQARVALVVGPTSGMADIVRDHGFGAVSADFDEPAIREVLDGLTSERVTQWKAAADGAARVLSAESQLPVWAAAIDALPASSR